MTTVDTLLASAAQIGLSLPQFASYRAEAAAAFRGRGLPTPRDEDWRYTSLAALKNVALEDGSVDAEGLAGLAAIDGALRIVARPGTWAELPHTGVSVRSIERGDTAPTPPWFASLTDPLDALNGAALGQGVSIEVAPNTTCELLIEIVFSGLRHPRHRIVVGAGASVRVVERWVGNERAYLVNPLTEIHAGAGAKVELVKIQQDGTQAFHLGSIHADLAANAQLRVLSVALGARVHRTRLHARLSESGHAEIRGVTFAGRGQVHDHQVQMHHAEPLGQSHQLFKGIVEAGGRSVFTGKIKVDRDAQQTDSTQQVRHLLLDEDAIANARPQLEILADDVKCSHGATVGHLDEEALFFLRSRGLDLAQARQLLTYAFATEVVSTIDHEPLRQLVENLLHQRLFAATDEANRGDA
jgi:Fe-S cluster assembly protein SufD